MTTAWKARLVGIALPLAIVGGVIMYESRTPIAPFALTAALGLLGLQYVWPRCRHCGARQILTPNRWLFLGEECRACGQPLDGPWQSEREQLATLRAQSDPTTARLLGEVERELAEEERLRALAPTSPTAAAQLRARLERKATAQRAFLDDFQASHPQAGQDDPAYQHLERAKRAHAAVLSELRMLSGRRDGA